VPTFRKDKHLTEDLTNSRLCRVTCVTSIIWYSKSYKSNPFFLFRQLFPDHVGFIFLTQSTIDLMHCQVGIPESSSTNSSFACVSEWVCECLLVEGVTGWVR
jgi:hypothetical protein